MVVFLSLVLAVAITPVVLGRISVLAIMVAALVLTLMLLVSFLKVRHKNWIEFQM